MYSDDYIRKEYRKITASVKKVRRIHSVVRKGLERTLARRYFGYTGTEEKSPVEVSMNIYWEDFVERVTAKKVNAVSEKVVNSSLVGVLLRR